jgi:hypothetical protein
MATRCVYSGLIWPSFEGTLVTVVQGLQGWRQGSDFLTHGSHFGRHGEAHLLAQGAHLGWQGVQRFSHGLHFCWHGD